MQKTVLVASKNPVKIEAIREGFFKVFPDTEYEFLSVEVSSGVSDQPFGMEETLTGAKNRVDHLVRTQPLAAFYAGIEGGVAEHEGELFAFAWIVIRNSEGYFGKSQTGHFPLPSRVKMLVENGIELGYATDQIFELHNSKQDIGAVGALTNQIIIRKDYYVHALILALIPFLKPDLFYPK